MTEMHPAPITPQSHLAATRLAGGLDALLWWPMSEQPHPEVTGFNETGEGVFRPRFTAKGYRLPVDDFDRANREVECPVRPGDRVGFREEFRWTSGVYCPGIEFRDGTKRFPEFDDFGTIPPYWMDLIGWQSPATQPLWSIRRFGVVASRDVGRPVDASEEDFELSGWVDSPEVLAGFVNDAAGLWWWKVRLNPMEDGR